MRDHRELGRILDLFMFSDFAPGHPIWLPDGNTVYSILSNKMREYNKKNGYVEVRTPVLWDHELFKQSGHWDHYKDNMYGVHGHEEDKLYSLKPMNCPGHMVIFGSKQWSYKDLPYRIHDQGMLHRDEVSGSIGGLTRTRSFCQDDAHIFLDPQHIGDEIKSLVKMIRRIYDVFGMKLEINFATQPKKAMGLGKTWEIAEDMIRRALKNDEHTVDEGGGAFYGPKIDFKVTDAQGRKWQTATIQLDFQLPQRFNLKYKFNDNSDMTPIVIHRALYGSFERFIAMALEHTDGNLPVWLCPWQVALLPVSDKQADYARRVVYNDLVDDGWRVQIDDSNNTLGSRIRSAEERRIPFILVVGAREENDFTVSVRQRNKKENEAMTVWGFDNMMKSQRDIVF